MPGIKSSNSNVTAFGQEASPQGAIGYMGGLAGLASILGGGGSSAASPMANTARYSSGTPSYGIGAGNVQGLGLGIEGGTAGSGTGGASTYGLGDGGSSVAGSFTGSQIPAFGSAAAGGTGSAAAGSSSWLPYAQAGGSILSTLFQGLLQMEQQRERNIQEIKMAQAKANVEREQAKNSALDRLVRVWGR